MNKPLFIYDGNCGFCLYSVRYFEKLTGEHVQYQPYQAVHQDYPSITTEEFQQAVKYVAEDGKITSGALATFQTLHHSPYNRLWLALYRWLPGFAWLSEKAYALIARHRDFFYRLCIFFFGRHYQPPEYNVITWYFLRGLGFLFLIAFYSFYTQALGLIGEQGIIPIHQLIAAANTELGTEKYWYLPMVFWWQANNLTIQVVCLTGMVAATTLIINLLPRLSLFVLYALYLSLIMAGQVFMTFQWDLLLIETSLLGIVLISHRVLGIWLLRFLQFKFILGAGLVKILSGDIAWRDYSALSYHFLTQPLPTPIAWYANQLPPTLLSIATGIALFIELIIVFLIFAPRHLRFFAAFSILFLQAGIFLTGNYNFFNLTTMLLCLPLFDDAALPFSRPQQRLSKPYKLTSFFVYCFAIIVIFLSIVQSNVRYNLPQPTSFIKLARLFSPLQIANSYGPFAVMTKKRYEIIIEGSDDGQHWVEYAFKDKPGDVMRPPLWTAPLQPRVDWQMWFAALSTPEQNPWLLQFLHRLLENSPDVTALLRKNPFPLFPPLYIRAEFYDYRFTTAKERAETGAWWVREWVGTYIPPFMK